MSLSRLLVGLALLSLVVLLFPGQVASATIREYSFDLGPGDDSVDVYVYLNEEQWAAVVVAFNESAEPADTQVWALTHYEYPSGTFGEEIARFTDVQHVEFMLAWNNATRLTVFLVRFIVRIFFFDAPAPAQVNVTVTVYGESSSSGTQTDPSDPLDESGTILPIVTAGAVSAAVLTMVAAIKMKRARAVG